MRRVLIPVSFVAALSVACHTITEDLPNRPSPVQVGGAPVIVVLVPVPTPTPLPSPVPVASPNPSPTATPDPGSTPAPSSTPTPSPGGQNRSPVARMACSVYFVECNGQVVPGSHRATSTSVGCRVHLDATTKDASGDHTYRTEPRWVYSNRGMIESAGRSAWNPVITARGPHHQEMYAEADGVRCNSFGISFN
jgi:hypothetical protein